MPIQTRFVSAPLARRVAALIVLAVLAGCGGSKVSKQSAVGIIERSPELKSGKLLYVPRVLAIPADGIVSSTATREGEALNIIQIASVDPVVAILRARDRVAIEDFVSAVQSSIVLPPKIDADSAAKADSIKAKNDSSKAKNDSSKSPNDSTRSPNDSTKAKPKPKPVNLNEPHTSPPPAPPLAQQWIHTLRVTPRSGLETSELVADDGDDNPENPRVAYGTQPIGRTPGWTLSVASREFVRILDVGAYTPSRGEPAGEAQIDFLWRWRPTPAGALFDTEGAAFESLPREVQQAALTGAITIDATTIHWARATVARDGISWKITSVSWMYGDDKPHDRW
jgi:hypothetical protein